jgi:hypothetical protein
MASVRVVERRKGAHGLSPLRDLTLGMTIPTLTFVTL